MIHTSHGLLAILTDSVCGFLQSGHESQASTLKQTVATSYQIVTC